MCCPRPDRARSRSAMIAAPAASDAACANAWGTPTGTGGLPSSPASDIGPADAHTVRSVAAQFAFGPSAPNALIDTLTRAGLIAASASDPNPSESRTPGPPDSISTSAPAISRVSSSRSPGLPARSSTIERLPRLRLLNTMLFSGHCRSARNGARRRAREPPVGSTRMTSAPN